MVQLHVVCVEQVTEVVLVVSGGSDEELEVVSGGGDEDVVVVAHVGVSGGV